MNLENRISECSLTLPTLVNAGANYTPVVIDRGLAWISGQLPYMGDKMITPGKLGESVSISDAQEGAKIALLRALGALRTELGGLERVRQIVKLTVYVNSTVNFTDQSAVADGASNVIFEIFGQQSGKHARTSVGVAQLPKNACVELDLVVALDEYTSNFVPPGNR